MGTNKCSVLRGPLGCLFISFCSNPTNLYFLSLAPVNTKVIPVYEGHHALGHVNLESVYSQPGCSLLLIAAGYEYLRLVVHLS